MLFSQKREYEVLWFGNGNLNSPILVRLNSKRGDKYLITPKNGQQIEVPKDQLRQIAAHERYLILGYNQLIRFKTYKDSFYNPAFQERGVNEVLFVSNDSAELVTILNINENNNEFNIVKHNAEILTVSNQNLRNITSTQYHFLVAYSKLIKQKINEKALDVFMDSYNTYQNIDEPTEEDIKYNTYEYQEKLEKEIKNPVKKIFGSKTIPVKY